MEQKNANINQRQNRKIESKMFQCLNHLQEALQSFPSHDGMMHRHTSAAGVAIIAFTGRLNAHGTLRQQALQSLPSHDRMMHRNTAATGVAIIAFRRRHDAQAHCGSSCCNHCLHTTAY